jgi:hypothetical protein
MKITTKKKKDGHRYFYLGNEYIAFYTIREEKADIRLSKLHFDIDYDGIIITKREVAEREKDVKEFLEKTIPSKDLATVIMNYLKKDFHLL